MKMRKTKMKEGEDGDARNCWSWIYEGNVHSRHDDKDDVCDDGDGVHAPHDGGGDGVHGSRHPPQP